MRFALEGNAGAQAPHPLECGLCAYQAVTRTNFSPGAVRPCSIQFTRCSCGWTAAGQRRNPDITGALRPMAQSPAYTTRSGLRRATVLQATKSYRGFESDALRQRVCTWGVVPACVARKAPQWGLSFVERPPENGPSVPERANSPNFLWGVIVEWSFVRQDDQMSMDEPRDYFQWKSEQPLRVRIPTGPITTVGSNPDRWRDEPCPFSRGKADMLRPPVNVGSDPKRSWRACRNEPRKTRLPRALWHSFANYAFGTTGRRKCHWRVSSADWRPSLPLTWSDRRFSRRRMFNRGLTTTLTEQDYCYRADPRVCSGW